MNLKEDEIYYARLITRVKAALIDGLILVIWIITVPFILQSNNTDVTTYRVLLMFLPVLLYEPVMISLFGCTIGQRIMGIRVYTEEDLKKCPFHLSFIRWIIKSALGFLSFLMMFFTDKYQALHDKAAGTVVILKPGNNNENEDKEIDGYTEQSIEKDYVYPSALRRILFFFLWYLIYWVISVIFLSIFLAIFYGDVSSYEEQFGEGSILFTVYQIVSFIILILCLVFAYKGLLPGAMRKKNPEIEETENNSEI